MRNFKSGGSLALFVGMTAALTGGSAQAQKARPVWEEARAAQLKAARQAGLLPASNSAPAPAIPAEQNAATYIPKIQAMDKAAPLSPQDSSALEALNKAAPSPEEIARGRKVLETHRERLQLIHQMAQAPAYREAAATVRVAGISVPDSFPRYALFRNHARWLRAESMLLLYDKKPLEAVQVDRLVFHLAHHVVADSSLLSFLVSTAIHSIALNDLRTILYREGNNPIVAEAVLHLIDEQGGVPALNAAVRGEALVGLEMLDTQRKLIPQIVQGDPNDAKNPPFRKTAEYRAWTKKYHYPTEPKQAAMRNIDMNDAHILEWMRRLLPLVDLPYPQALAGITSITQEAKKNADHPDYILAAMAISTWEELPAAKARHQADAETVRAAAALLALKAQKGHFPETLAECLNPAPIDPFNRQALHYRREGEGFVIYSVGKTGKFDGGQPEKRPTPNESLFRYPRPAYIK